MVVKLKKERIDAELHYLQSCNTVDTTQSEFLQNNPRYIVLSNKYGHVQSTKSDSLSGGKHFEDLISVTISSHAPASITKKPVNKQLPLSLTVGNLKLICSKLFNLDPTKQVLFFHETKEFNFPQPLDDNSRTLSYYGLLDHCNIIMEQKL